MFPEVNTAMTQAEGPSLIADTVPAWRFSKNAALVLGALAGFFVFSHWATLVKMAERWSSDPQYSHGFIVPVFALVVLWSRRDLLNGVVWEPAWVGGLLMGIGFALRYIAIPSDIESLDALSLLPTLFGMTLLVGGWSVLRWTWPALAFLGFMMPLPFSAEMAMSQPLRRIATEMSTYVLQTLGCPAWAEGNIIFIDEIPLGVEQACSGLGMLMTFFALATAMAMIVHASLADRLILVASAIPIAILANVIRITATGYAYHLGGRDSQLAQLIYHDLAGWLMMPLAVAMLWLELKLLSRLLIEVPDAAPLPMLLTQKTMQMPKVI
jgi:exosortase